MRPAYIVVEMIMAMACILATTCCTIGVDMPTMPDTLIVQHVFEDTYSQILLALPSSLCVDLGALDYFVLGTLAGDLEEGYTVTRVVANPSMLIVTLEKGGVSRNYATPRVVWVKPPRPSGQFLF